MDAPAATPVASDGGSMPPTAPARMNSAVSTGFATIATVTAISVSPPARLSTMMLLPLPGICGIQIEQAPVSNPANPIVTRRVHEAGGDLGRAGRISPVKAGPAARATGVK